MAWIAHYLHGALDEYRGQEGSQGAARIKIAL